MRKNNVVLSFGVTIIIWDFFEQHFKFLHVTYQIHNRKLQLYRPLLWLQNVEFFWNSSGEAMCEKRISILPGKNDLMFRIDSRMNWMLDSSI